MNGLHITHIIFPLLLGFIYIYFIIFLNHIKFLSFLLIGIFLIMFFFYGLVIYALFHRKPGFENYSNAENKMGVDKICEYKQNEQRKYELKVMMKQNITYQRLRALQNQYLMLYRQNSFCDTCQIIRSPRSNHCTHCDKCVLRRQKHSELVDMCIGEKNMKIFMQYLFIGMILSLYMTISLILITVLEHHKLNDFNTTQLVLFAFIEMSLGGAVLLYGKEFFISYFNAMDNITETQRKIGIITKKNNPFKDEKYYQGLFKSTVDYLKLGQIADPTNWLQLQQQHQ